MQFDSKELFVNIPIKGMGYIFELPEIVYTNRFEAEKALQPNYYTENLVDAAERIAWDSQE